MQSKHALLEPQDINGFWIALIDGTIRSCQPVLLVRHLVPLLPARSAANNAYLTGASGG
jgi:hypothetical protein